MLTYSDNPEANIPRYVYNYIVNQGGPYFLKQVKIGAVSFATENFTSIQFHFSLKLHISSSEYSWMALIYSRFILRLEI